MHVQRAAIGQRLCKGQAATQVDGALVVNRIRDRRAGEVQRAGVRQRAGVGPGHGVCRAQAEAAAGHVQVAGSGEGPAGYIEIAGDGQAAVGWQCECAALQVQVDAGGQHRVAAECQAARPHGQ